MGHGSVRTMVVVTGAARFLGAFARERTRSELAEATTRVAGEGVDLVTAGAVAS
jgi:hypothetical protein